MGAGAIDFDPSTAKLDQAFDPESASLAEEPVKKETFSVPSRPRQFVSSENMPARMITKKVGMREVPIEGPIDRGIYEAGGRVTDKLTELGASPEVAAAGGGLTNFGLQAATTMIGGGGGKALEPAAKVAGQALMRQALKPGATAIKNGTAERAINSMLEEGISVSKGGREKAAQKIEDLKTIVDDLTSRSNGSANIIDALKPARELIERYKHGGTDYAEKIKNVQDEVAKLLDHPDVRQQLRIPVATANQIKRGLYQEIGDPAFKTGIKSGSVKEAKDALAHGLNEQVVKFVPEAKAINKHMGDLIEARKFLDSRLARQSASNMLSPWTLLLATHNPKLAALHAAQYYPQTSSALARLLYSGGLESKLGAGAGALYGNIKGSPTAE